jgi:hypothetical protein
LGYYIADAEGNLIYDFGKSKFVKNLPRVTICTILDGNKISFGYSTCSDKDSYNRKVGNKIAYSRAIKKPYKVVELTNIKEIHDISLKVVEEIFDLETKRIYGVSD